MSQIIKNDNMARYTDEHIALQSAVKNKLCQMHFSARRQKNYRKSLKRTFAICSQCARGMDRDMAAAQIENKRENAPICMACIMGYARRPLGQKKTDWKAMRQDIQSKLTE